MQRFILSLTFLTILALSGCRETTPDLVPVIGPIPVQPQYNDIKYCLGGSSGSYDITYFAQGEVTRQDAGVNNNWSYSFKAGPGDSLYLSAQNHLDHGTVSVYIYRDNKLWKSATSTGAYVIARVSGSN